MSGITLLRKKVDSVDSYYSWRSATFSSSGVDDQNACTDHWLELVYLFSSVHLQ